MGRNAMPHAGNPQNLHLGRSAIGATGQQVAADIHATFAVMRSARFFFGYFWFSSADGVREK